MQVLSDTSYAIDMNVNDICKCRNMLIDQALNIENVGCIAQ